MKDISSEPLPVLAPRAPDSHKGDYGRAWIVGGSVGMAGAPALAGKACLRSGAGLVSLAVPKTIQPTVASFLPDYMTTPLLEKEGCIAAEATGSVLELYQRATAGGIGPGLGRSDDVREFVRRIYSEAACPLVVDADALFALAQHGESLTNPAAPRVLTPHAGEFALLSGLSRDALGDDSNRAKAAAELAQRDQNNQTIVLLKGHRTVITDGDRYCFNPTGNPGMATGGAGDVLTGIITALLCQGLETFDAARLGAYVHGLSGDYAAEAMGELSVTASDLIDWLPEAWRQTASSDE